MPASAEQSSGVAQVNKAMARVDEVTQRNASAAEELASTAEEMAAQAQALEQLVAFFQVDGRVVSAPPVTVPRVETSPRVSLYLGDLARRRPANGSATPAALGDLRS